MTPGSEVLCVRTGEIVTLVEVVFPGADGVHLAVIRRECEAINTWAAVV